MKSSDILVVVPHSGLIVPAEIPLDALSDEFPVLAQNVDWYTNWLYDFRDVLGTRHSVFPYCSLLLEANRHPLDLDACVPLQDVLGRPVYRAGREPGPDLRRHMARTYLDAFHSAVGDAIAGGASFLFEGHSTLTARGVADDQIDLMNVQRSPGSDGEHRSCPDAWIADYADELKRRLPEVRVTVNASEYISVYGHIAAEHSVDAPRPVGRKAPALLQETNENLYKNRDRTPNIPALNRLRRAFAESLWATLRDL